MIPSFRSTKRSRGKIFGIMRVRRLLLSISKRLGFGRLTSAIRELFYLDEDKRFLLQRIINLKIQTKDHALKRQVVISNGLEL